MGMPIISETSPYKIVQSVRELWQRRVSKDQLAASFYAEGLWTPVLTFATPGDLSVVYTVQAGIYRKVGSVLHLTCDIFATPTWTTAAGELRVTGIPFSALASPNVTHRGTMRWAGINKVGGYAEVIPSVNSGATFAAFTAVGMGLAGANVLAADMTSGASMRASFQITYPTD